MELGPVCSQTVKRLSTMRKTWVRSLGGEDLLEKEMATHSSILARKIPWTEEPGRLYSPWGRTRLSDFTFNFSHLEPRAYFEQGWTQLAYISICSVGEGIPVSFQGPREISALGTSEIRSQKDFTFPTPNKYLSQHDLPDSRMVP